MQDKSVKRRTMAEPEEVLTREQLQKRLRERMAAGDMNAKRLWEEYKRVDMLLDAFRDIPLYPNHKKEKKNEKR